jgi:hypothetical protein
LVNIPFFFCLSVIHNLYIKPKMKFYLLVKMMLVQKVIFEIIAC